nr:MAG TPA: hypothetical protein [Caudoviricetes sp.]
MNSHIIKTVDKCFYVFQNIIYLCDFTQFNGLKFAKYLTKCKNR